MDYPELLAQIESGVIKIPDFQRSVIWDISQTLYLLDSVSKGFPIGSFIFWNTQDRMRAHRNVGDLPLKDVQPGRQVSYVLDGQQRLTSLYACLKRATIKGKAYRVFCDLDASGEADVFTLEPDASDRFLDLSSILGDDPQFAYDKLTPERKKRFNAIREAFRLYKFSVIRIEDQPLDVVCEIFTRINNSGTELDLFDLMVAKTWQEDFNLRDQYDALCSRLEKAQFDALGTSAIVQTVSGIIKRGCTRKVTLSIKREEMGSTWVDVAKALELAVDFLRDKVGIPTAKLLPYQSAVAPLSYFFFRKDFKQPDARESKHLERYFWRSAAIGRYAQGTESKLTQDLAEVDRLIKGEDRVFDYPEGWTAVDRDSLTRTDLSLQNANCKMVLAFLASRPPLSLENNREVRVDSSSLARSNSRHLHHFFPKKHLARKGVSSDRANSVVNICFVPAESNLRYRDKAPDEYLAPLRESNPNLGAALRSHLIEDTSKFGISSDNYDVFLEARANEIKIGLHSLVLTHQEFDDAYPDDSEHRTDTED